VASADVKTLELADGNMIPMLGLRVWQVDNSREAVDAVRWALELGYRHVDTAQAYGNEESVGRGFRDSGVAREEIFVTTKFFPRRDDPFAALEAGLRQRPRSRRPRSGDRQEHHPGAYGGSAS
jgi:diketogulonate reductase-like aldo/keto reductase